MTAVMQPSSSPFMSPAFRPGHGILLNPSPRTTAFPLPTPTPTPTPLPHPASYTSLSSSSSSAATDEDALYSSSTDVDAHPARTHRSRSLPAPHSAPARKIRFAPLPDPRRAVFVTDGGDELPIPLSDDDGKIVSSAARVGGDSNNTKKFTIGMDSRSPSVSPQVRASANSDWELVDSPRINSCKLPPPAIAPESQPPSLASSVSSYQANYEYTTSPAPSMPSSPTSASCFPGTLPNSGKRGLTSKLLRPFTISKKPSLSFSNTSTESVGLPRTSSRETESSVFGVPLHRFSSTQSTQSSYSTASASTIGPSSFTFGGALARSQSLTSEPDDSRKKKLLAGVGGGKRKKRPSSASGSTASLQSGQRGTNGGVRMLNGRIYGAKHHNQYQYQNKNPFATVSSRTEPEFVEWGYGGMGSVDSGAGNAVWKKLQSGETIGGTEGGRGAARDDEDDGSGMGWVKKRREKRERERKEQEERERAEREKANPEIRVSAPQEEVESKEEEKPVEVVAEKEAPVEEEEAPLVVAEKEEPEHVYTTVAVPVVQAHPHPSRTHSHSEEERERAKSPPALMTPSANEDEEDDDDEESPRSEEASAEGIPEEDEDEEDEDEEEEERRRVTALGAGLEKVSRHKEADERER